MRPHGSPEELERRRIKAIELLSKEFKPVSIAQRLEVERRSVRRWNAKFRKYGMQGIRAKPASGRPLKLSLPSRRKLADLLLRGAKANGFSTDLWTCSRIARVISDQFGVHHNVVYLGRLLRQLGWTPQRPSKRALERDEEAIQEWIDKTWPRIKKGLHAQRRS